jgi:hypothetical protein
MADPTPLNRNQIARFVGNDPDAIRAIERLFVVAGQLVPADVAIIKQLILDNTFALGAADNKAEVALSDATDAKRLADLLAMAPVAPVADGRVDYIDFNPLAPHVSRIRRLAWDDGDQTAQIGMDYGVVQQVGMDLYARVENATGVTIPKGTVVGFAGVGPNNVLSVTPYLADGSTPTLYILGVMAHDLPNAGEIGYCSVWGHIAGIDTSAFSVGDVLYASPTVAGGFTATKPTAPDNVVPVAAVLEADATTGQIFVRPTIEQQKYYGVFEKTNNQTPTAINTENLITFTGTQISNTISIGTPASRIVVPESGFYQFDTQVQLTSGSAADKNVWVWFKKNGTTIPNSARLVTISVNGGYSPIALVEIVSLAANDYIEIAFAADSTNVTISTVAATAFAPAAPAVLLSVAQVQQ